jgi:hypothetical protein
MMKRTLAQRINEAREGKTQSWIILEMKKKGCIGMTDSKFSRRKHEHETFTKKEFEILKEILPKL